LDHEEGLSVLRRRCPKATPYQFPTHNMGGANTRYMDPLRMSMLVACLLEPLAEEIEHPSKDERDFEPMQDDTPLLTEEKAHQRSIELSK
jgi:hypothetical protein